MRLTLRRFSYGMIIGALCVKAWSVLFGVADKSLWMNQYSFNGVINPEGWLWSALNPLWFGQFGYRLWCFAFDCLMLFLWLEMGEPGKRTIPRILLAFEQVISIYAYTGWGHTYQNITIIAMMPGIALTAKWALLPLMMKLPVWFDWRDLYNHIGCALYCTPVHGVGNYSTYAVLGFCFLLPFAFRGRLERWRALEAMEIR